MIGTASLDKICFWTDEVNFTPFEGLTVDPSIEERGQKLGHDKYYKNTPEYNIDIKYLQKGYSLKGSFNPSKIDPHDIPKLIKQDTGVIFNFENSIVTRCDIQRTGQARYPVNSFHSIIQAATGRKPSKQSTYNSTITTGTTIRQFCMYDKGEEQRQKAKKGEQVFFPPNYLRAEARLLKTTACRTAGINTVQDLLECDPAELYRKETARMLPYLDSLNKEDYNHAATLYERYAHLVNDAGNEGFLRKVLELEGLYNTPESVMFAFIDALPVPSYRKSKIRKQYRTYLAKYPIPKQADIVAELLRFVA